MDFNRKSIWKITASVSVVLMLLTLGVFTASACQAEESPAYCDQNSPSPGDYDKNCLGDDTFPLPANEAVSCNGGCDKSNCTGDFCDGCTEADCEGDCCDKCTDVCGKDNCTGDCCDDCTENCDDGDCADYSEVTECNGDCCENCVDECGQACDQESCTGNFEETCDQTDCTTGSEQAICSK